MDSKLLNQGFIRWWATGNKSPILRSRMIARAPVLATQLMIFWSFPPIILLWIIHMADTQGALAPKTHCPHDVHVCGRASGTTRSAECVRQAPSDIGSATRWCARRLGWGHEAKPFHRVQSGLVHICWPDLRLCGLHVCDMRPIVRDPAPEVLRTGVCRISRLLMACKPKRPQPAADSVRRSDCWHAEHQEWRFVRVFL